MDMQPSPERKAKWAERRLAARIDVLEENLLASERERVEKMETLALTMKNEIAA